MEMPTSVRKASAELERVLALLERFPLIDAHNDLPMVIRNDPEARGDVVRFDLRRRHSAGDTDLPRLREGRVSGQVWAAFVPSESRQPEIETLEQIDLILRMNEAYRDAFHPVLHADDFLEAHRQGKIASMMAVEGGVGMGESLAPLRMWHQLGVRLMTLCHNKSLAWVDSATGEQLSGGLSPFGRQVIAEMNRLGMVVDCSHVSDDAMRAVLDTTAAPVVFSHSNARALCNHKRNVPDDVLTRVVANGGMVMATFIPDFVSEEVRSWIAPIRAAAGITLPENWDEMRRQHILKSGREPMARLDQVADQIEYLAARLGSDHIGIGSDFWGSTVTTEGLRDVSCYPQLLAELAGRGWSDENLAKLAGLNFIRLFRAVEARGEAIRAASA